MSIATKFFATTSLIVALIAAFVFYYYPAQYKKTVMQTLESQVVSMGESVALGVALGRHSNSFKKVKEALNWVAKDPEVIFISLYDGSDKPYASYNPDNFQIGNKSPGAAGTVTKHKNLLCAVVAVKFEGNNYGKLKIGYSLRTINEIIFKNRLITILVCLGIMVLGMGLSLAISERITSPLRRLTVMANKISEGNMYIRPDINSSDEVGDLAKAMQIMLEKNENAISEIQEINVNLEREREKAVVASKAKSEFLSRMSHELRTPMNAIMGFAQLIQRNLNSPRGLLETRIRIISKAGSHLLSLVNEILDLSKIEAGKTKLAIENVDLNVLIKEAVAVISPLADKRNIKITATVDIPENQTGLFASADPMRIKQILYNLLSNAVKFNKEGGTCEINAYRELKENSRDSFIIISVKDTGIGIPKEKMASMFEAFEKLHSGNLNVEGAGIGLNITKRLVELMGGTIEVNSVQEEGTCFTIRLHEGSNESPSVELEQRESIPAKFIKSKSRKATILYVEDNQENMELVEQALSTIPNLELFTATTAEQGIELAISKVPDLILMDINLPGMDGIEAMEHLKNTPRTWNIPMVALSAYVMRADIEQAIKAGFDYYITKPIELDSFLTKIAGFLGLEYNASNNMDANSGRD